MARRTVTATISGGMISDAAEPGTVRYMENYLVNNGVGLVPAGPVADISVPFMQVSGASGARSGMNAYSKMYGWVAVSPMNDGNGGYCGILEYATASASSSAVSAVTAGQTSATRFALMRTWMNSQSTASSDGFWANSTANFVQSGDYRPCGGFISTATAASGCAAAFNNAYNTMKATEISGETLFYDQSWGISRYAGGYWQGDTGFNYSGDTVTSQSDEVTAVCQITSSAGTYTTGTYTDAIKVYGAGNTTMLRVGSFICLGMGQSLESSLTASTSTGTNNIQLRALKILDYYTDNGSDFTVKVDRKVMCSRTDVYFKGVLSPVATLDINQISVTAQTQPWEPAKTGPYSGFTNQCKPKPRHICEHGGRLFSIGFYTNPYVYSDKTLRWSATIDETLQATGVTVAMSSTATSAAVTGTTANFGVEYSGITLWSTSADLPVFPSIGGASVGLASFGDELLIMRQGAIFRMVGGVSYDGESDALSIQIISDTVGPDSEHSWAKTQEGIVFTCNGSIFLYDGNQVSNISEGTISRAYRENLLTETQSNGLRYETKVSNAGDIVIFSMYRPSVSTGAPYSYRGYPPITASQLAGSSIHNKHLVLNTSNKTWAFISNRNINVPVRFLELGDSDRGGLSKILFNKWRPLSYGSTSTSSPTAVPSWYKASFSIADLGEVFHASGVRTDMASATMGDWTRRLVSPDVGSVITHPMLGYGKMEAVRPRAVAVKRTIAATSTGYMNRFTDTPTSVADYNSVASKLFVHDCDAGYVPLTDQSGSRYPQWWYVPRSGEASGTPPTTYTDGTRSASMSDQQWQIRTEWDIPFGSSTGVMASQVDKIMLNNIESVMSSPTVHYRDSFWSDADPNLSYKSHIVHAIQVEYDDVENGSDR